MPTNRKRILRSRISAGGVKEIDYVFFSFGPFFEAEDYQVGKTPGDLEAFWKDHKAEIMERWFREHRERCEKAPGYRPWGFWVFNESVKAPRLKITSSDESDLRNWDHIRKVYDWVEDDFRYLKRLGLLEEWEINIIRH